jgi:hypothetical protein
METGRPPGSLDVKMGFDLCFKNFQVLVDAAGGYAAKLAVDPVEIRKNNQPHAEGQDSQHI